MGNSHSAHNGAETQIMTMREATFAQAIATGQLALGQYATPHSCQAAEAAVATYIALTHAEAPEERQIHIPYVDSD